MKITKNHDLFKTLPKILVIGKILSGKSNFIKNISADEFEIRIADKESIDPETDEISFYLITLIGTKE